jgi:hypothetical protein
VNDSNRIAFTILAGAVIGGFAGFLLFTDRGRRLRMELQPRLDDVAREMRGIQELAVQLRATANESWRQLESFVAELGQKGPPFADDLRRH